MKKIKVVDLCSVEEEEKVYYDDIENVIGSWKEYFNELKTCSIDEIDFELKDILKSVFIIDDGSEIIRLKNLCFVNVCWRGSICRCWIEDDLDTIEELIEYTDKVIED